MQPPSLGARVLARFLDGLLVSVGLATALAVGGVDDLAEGQRAALAATIAVVYDAVAVARWRRTIGKRVVGTAVVADASGGPVGWGPAAVRAIVLLVPIYLLAPRIDSVVEWIVLVLVVANLVVIATRRDDRRGIHDLAAGTRPVATPRPGGAGAGS